MKRENFDQEIYIEEGITFKKVVNIFFRRIRTFGITAVIIFLLTFLYQLLKPYRPVYRSTFDVGVRGERVLEGVFSTTYEAPLYQLSDATQKIISTLISTKLSEKIVDSLDLCAFIEEKRTGIKIKIRKEENITNIIGPFKLIIKNKNFELTDRNRNIHIKGELNKWVKFNSFEFKIIPIREISEAVYTITFYPEETAAISLRNSISIRVLEVDRLERTPVFGGIPESGEKIQKRFLIARNIYPGLNMIGILRVNVFWGDPEKSFRIAQFLSNLLIEENLKEKTLKYSKSKEFVENQLEFYENKLKELEEEIRSFKEQNKITDLKASTQSLISQVSELESQKTKLNIEKSTLEEIRKTIVKGEKRETLQELSYGIVSSPSLRELYSEYLKVESEYRTRLKSYSENHPKVHQSKAKLEGLKEQIKKEVEKRLSSIETEIQSIEEELKILKVKLKDIPEEELYLARLERDKEIAEKLYTFFSEKLEEMRVQIAGITPDLKIINPPVLVPGAVNKRSIKIMLLISLILSIIIGLVLIFTVEYFDNTLKDPDVLRKMNIPVLSLIPVVEGENFLNPLNRIIKNNKNNNNIKIIEPDISSPEFEAFRKLSINIEFSHPEKKYKTIYITSSVPEEGKTFVVINLALVFASKGKKVVVVDTDFRKKKGHITDIFNIKKKEGLFEILSGKADLKKCIVTIEKFSENSIPKIHILPTGEIPPNPLVFLESKKMEELINTLKKEYDYVIIDGTPVLLFVDSAYIANYADGTILITKYNKTNIKEIEESKEVLFNSKTHLIGSVINNIPRTRGTHYYYYYRYYSKYYGKNT